MLGEIGWSVDGRLVSHDVIAYQERIMLLYEGGVLDKLRMAWKRPRILEIGGGFGAIASAVSDMVGAQEYVICDLPESLMFSGLYKKITNPEARVSVN
jgi:hypothetical protein